MKFVPASCVNLCHACIHEHWLVLALDWTVVGSSPSGCFILFSLFLHSYSNNRCRAEPSFFIANETLQIIKNPAIFLSLQATKNPFYLHVGKDILTSLNLHTKSECGYATIHDVDDKSLEDRQESFFLSETCKYLYLLFDLDNPVNRLSEKYLFTTEGHVFPINDQLRKKIWQDELFQKTAKTISSRPSWQTRHEIARPIFRRTARTCFARIPPSTCPWRAAICRKSFLISASTRDAFRVNRRHVTHFASIADLYQHPTLSPNVISSQIFFLIATIFAVFYDHQDHIYDSSTPFA